MRTLLGGLAVATLVLGAACTTSQTAVPAPSGPAELGLSLRVTASPDSLSQDGAAQSTVAVNAFNFEGRPESNLEVRVDMIVNNQLQDYGTLSQRTIRTDAGGKAVTVYTAPPPPRPEAGGSSTVVVLRVTPTRTNNLTATSEIATIRLVPPGVILPAANTPTARFTFSSPVNVGQTVVFDGSSSCPRGVDSAGVCLPPSSAGATITSYAWSFGDGSSSSGQTASHKFTSVGTFNVRLTVTNDRGVQGSSSQAVTTSATVAPSVDFIWSPTPVLVNATTSFNADATQAAPGHTIVQYSWDFGDGTSGDNSFSVTHVFKIAQTYTVVLTVMDDTGQKATKKQDVAVLSGDPVPQIVAAPGGGAAVITINFNSVTSKVFGGASITSYAWDFGDAVFSTPANPNSSVSANPSHTYVASGVYVVRLTITDSFGRVGTVSISVTIT